MSIHLPFLSKLSKAWHAALATAALLVMTGCASLQSPTSAVPTIEPSTAPSGLLACADWYTALDAATDNAGARDAGAARIAGFAHLRADRFTASLGDELIASKDDTATRQAALVQRLLALDLQARAVEIANLPVQARTQLAKLASNNTSTYILQRTQACGEQLAAYDTASPPRMAALLQRLKVPDDYVTGYRVAGAYAISQIPFAAGIRKMEAERLAVFAKDSPPAVDTTRMRFTPAASAATHPSSEQLRSILAPTDPLRIPSPSPADLTQLFAQFAPSFDIDVASDDDKPGTLVWSTPTMASPALTLDTSTPALYQQVAHTRYANHNLLQLVYTLWFPARPKAPGSSFDLLAGKLDGIVWRVTLAPDGTPLVYDTIHPCGCYHMFFPTPGVQPKPAPQSGIEWAFVPTALPAVTGQDRVVIRVASRTHYIDRVSIEPAATVSSVTQATTLAPHDYHSLRALPLPASALNATTSDAANSRSVFSPTGFIDGTDRGERFLFWPMGIARAGTMRQWGKHATAFVGRRHFDDATLMQERFEIDAKYFQTGEQQIK